MEPPPPPVTIEDEPLPGPNINERVRSNEATLEEPVLTKAHQVVAERLGNSQAYDLNERTMHVSCTPNVHAQFVHINFHLTAQSLHAYWLNG